MSRERQDEGVLIPAESVSLQRLAQLRNPVASAARRALQYAVKSGRLIRPGSCSSCGREGKPHGHHADYARPLEVTWLCARCHGKAHALLNELESVARAAARLARDAADPKRSPSADVDRRRIGRRRRALLDGFVGGPEVSELRFRLQLAITTTVDARWPLSVPERLEEIGRCVALARRGRGLLSELVATYR